MSRGKDIWTYLNHSRHYHDYFEGYAERKTPGSDGRRTRIERVYVREYYRQDVSDRARLLLRICYVPLYLLGAGIFLYTGTRQTEGNMALYVTFSCFLTLVMMLWTAIVLFSWLSAPREMTLWEYHSGSVRLRGAAFAAGILLVLDTAATGIFILLNHDSVLKGNLLSMLGFSVSALLMFTLHYAEKKVPYRKIPNETVRNKSSFLIEA